MESPSPRAPPPSRAPPHQGPRSLSGLVVRTPGRRPGHGPPRPALQLPPCAARPRLSAAHNGDPNKPPPAPDTRNPAAQPPPGSLPPPFPLPPPAGETASVLAATPVAAMLPALPPTPPGNRALDADRLPRSATGKSCLFFAAGEKGPRTEPPGGGVLTEQWKTRPARALRWVPRPPLQPGRCCLPAPRSLPVRPCAAGAVPACCARRTERRFPSSSLPLRPGRRPPRSCRHHEVRTLADPRRPIRGHPPRGGRRRAAPSPSANPFSPLTLFSRAGSSCAASAGTRSTRAMGAATPAPTAR